MRVEPNYISHIVLISSLDKTLRQSKNLLEDWSVSGVFEIHFEDYVQSQLIAPTFHTIFNRNPDNYYILVKTHFEDSPILRRVMYEFYQDMIGFLANNLYDVKLRLFYKNKEIPLNTSVLETRNYQSDSMVAVSKYVTNRDDLQNKITCYTTIYNIILEMEKLNFGGSVK